MKQQRLPVDPVTIFNMADAILNGAGLIQNAKSHASSMVPEIILAAFASEIYLKTLLVIEGTNPPPQGHNLHDLWQELSDASKKSLDATWRKMFKGGTYTNKELGPLEVATNFGDALAACARAFEAARYAYEPKNESFLFPPSVPTMLRQQVLRLRPGMGTNIPNQGH